MHKKCSKLVQKAPSARSFSLCYAPGHLTLHQLHFLHLLFACGEVKGGGGGNSKDSDFARA